MGEADLHNQTRGTLPIYRMSHEDSHDYLLWANRNFYAKDSWNAVLNVAFSHFFLHKSMIVSILGWFISLESKTKRIFSKFIIFVQYQCIVANLCSDEQNQLHYLLMVGYPANRKWNEFREYISSLIKLWIGNHLEYILGV